MKAIPKSFSLGPHEITVHEVTVEQMMEIDPTGPLGLWSRDAHTIHVQKPRRGFTKSAQLHTFWHELTHAVFETLGFDELSHNEQLVDLVGLLLLQATQTFKR